MPGHFGQFSWECDGTETLSRQACVQGMVIVFLLRFVDLDPSVPWNEAVVIVNGNVLAALNKVSVVGFGTSCEVVKVGAANSGVGAETNLG